MVVPRKKGELKYGNQTINLTRSREIDNSGNNPKILRDSQGSELSRSNNRADSDGRRGNLERGRFERLSDESNDGLQRPTLESDNLNYKSIETTRDIKYAKDTNETEVKLEYENNNGTEDDIRRVLEKNRKRNGTLAVSDGIAQGSEWKSLHSSCFII